MTPQLTVVLVTRNAMPFATHAAAQAAEAAQRWDAQVVAIDADSSDGTWEVLSGYPDWTVRRQRSTGLAAARNEAVALADGRVIAFLDADDVWLPGKTDTQLRVLMQRPEIDVVSCLLRRVGAVGEVDPTAHGQVALTPSGCLIRREVFHRVGAFDPRYTIAADHDWFVRAQAAGVGIDVLPQVLVHKGMHAANLSHDRSTYRRELARVFRSLHGSAVPAGD